MRGCTQLPMYPNGGGLTRLVNPPNQVAECGPVQQFARGPHDYADEVGQPSLRHGGGQAAGLRGGGERCGHEKLGAGGGQLRCLPAVELSGLLLG